MELDSRVPCLQLGRPGSLQRDTGSSLGCVLSALPHSADVPMSVQMCLYKWNQLGSAIVYFLLFLTYVDIIFPEY